MCHTTVRNIDVIRNMIPFFKKLIIHLILMEIANDCLFEWCVLKMNKLYLLPVGLIQANSQVRVCHSPGIQPKVAASNQNVWLPV